MNGGKLNIPRYFKAINSMVNLQYLTKSENDCNKFDGTLENNGRRGMK
jgi:hypothetical protein